MGEELKDRQICARAFHIFKCQAMRQRFDAQMKALHLTLDSNRELSERLARASQEERGTMHSFTAVAKEISLVEQKTEELHAKVEADTEQRHRLQSWRKNKIKQLTHLDST